MSIAHLMDKQRFIGFIEKEKGPILLIIGGIHGNEPSGLQAISNVMNTLTDLSDKLLGSVFAIKGNISAIEQNKRYIDTDLNRIWATDIANETIKDKQEYQEFLAIKAIIDEIRLTKGDRQLILLDLHTTSSSSLPFILCSNEIRNRRLVKPIPVPTILGIENRIKGTLMNYINELGDSGIVFEAGQHDDPMAVKYHESMIQLLLVACGILNQSDLANYEDLVHHFYSDSKSMQYIFEVMYRYGIKPDEQFTMQAGFENFMSIKQGQVLAKNEKGEIIAPLPGRIFMPLYQSQGDDGFFIIDEVV